MNSQQRRKEKRFRRAVQSLLATGEYLPDLADLKAAGGLTAHQAIHHARMTAQIQVDALSTGALRDRILSAWRILRGRRAGYVWAVHAPHDDALDIELEAVRAAHAADGLYLHVIDGRRRGAPGGAADPSRPRQGSGRSAPAASIQPRRGDGL